MIKVIFLQTGACIVTEDEMRNGRRWWKCPLFMDYIGAKINFKSLYHYTKGDEFPVNDSDILFEDEATEPLKNHYRNATEKFSAGKAGLVIPEMTPPQNPQKLVH